jgi:hypothetical protein
MKTFRVGSIKLQATRAHTPFWTSLSPRVKNRDPRGNRVLLQAEVSTDRRDLQAPAPRAPDARTRVPPVVVSEGECMLQRFDDEWQVDFFRFLSRALLAAACSGTVIVVALRSLQTIAEAPVPEGRKRNAEPRIRPLVRALSLKGQQGPWVATIGGNVSLASPGSGGRRALPFDGALSTDAVIPDAEKL